MWIREKEVSRMAPSLLARATGKVELPSTGAEQTIGKEVLWRKITSFCWTIKHQSDNVGYTSLDLVWRNKYGGCQHIGRLKGMILDEVTKGASAIREERTKDWALEPPAWRGENFTEAWEGPTIEVEGKPESTVYGCHVRKACRGGTSASAEPPLQLASTWEVLRRWRALECSSGIRRWLPPILCLLIETHVALVFAWGYQWKHQVGCCRGESRLPPVARILFKAASGSGDRVDPVAVQGPTLLHGKLREETHCCLRYCRHQCWRMTEQMDKQKVTVVKSYSQWTRKRK